MLRALVAAAVVVAYFLLPLDLLGPRRPALSWSVFCLVLAVVAVSLLRQVRHVLTDRAGTRPGMAIALLTVLVMHVFAAADYSLAKQPGEFTGLETRLDALYFTVVTLATVGYGDITPSGQTARVVVIVQILYTLVFLTAGATALGQRLRAIAVRRAEPREGERAD
ncbi:ion channel [Streptomyces sp. ZYX-F-203]